MYPLVNKILIADDHPLIRHALRMMIKEEFDLDNISEVENFNGLMEALEKENYSHLILDLMLADQNSADHFYLLRKKFPGVAVLIFTMHHEEIFGPPLMKLGARCYLNKQASDSEVISCMKSFFTGRKYSRINNPTSKNGHEFQQTNPFANLSQREREVLQHVLQGNGTKEIAAMMDLHTNTITTFKKRMYEKLNVKNILDLKQLAMMYHVSYS